MATRINTKVVALLIAGVVLAAMGVVALAVFMNAKSPERNVAEGDEYFAQGQFELAANEYAKAVNKDSTNIEYLIKWREALVQVIPENEAAYEKRYREQYLASLQTLAQQQPFDPRPQFEYLNERERLVRRLSAMTPGAADVIVAEVNDRLAGLDVSAASTIDPPLEPEAYERMMHEIRAMRGRALTDKSSGVALSDEELARAESDLTEAYEATGDPDHLTRLFMLYESLSDRARTERRPQLAEEYDQRVDDVRARIAENHAGSPEAVLFTFIDTFFDRAEAAATPEERLSLFQAMRAPAAEAASEFRRAVEGGDDLELVLRGRRLLGSIGGQPAREDMIAALDTVIEVRPLDPMLLLFKGEELAELGRWDEAFDIYQSVIDMEAPPICLEGFMRPQAQTAALGAQIDILLDRAARANAEERDELLERASEVRDRLAERVATENAPQLLIRDARIALIENRLDDALRAITDYESAGPEFERDPQAMLFKAQAFLGRNQPGDARAALERVLEVRGPSPQTLVLLGQLEQRLGNLDRARDRYEAALALEPDNEVAARSRDLVVSLAGDEEQTPEGEANETARLLVNATRLVAEGDLEGGITILEQLLEQFPNNQTLLSRLVSLELIAGRRDSARQRVDAALEANPDNRQLRALKTQIEIEDPTQAALQVIDDSDQAPFEKHLARATILLRDRQLDRAKDELDAAQDINPSEPRLIALQFDRALLMEEDGLAAAERIVERAAEADADGYEGDVYRGRLQLARGDIEDSIESFRGVAQRAPYDAEVWRWLGTAQQVGGQTEQAIESLRRAYDSRPSDASYAYLLARALNAAGRGDEARRVLSPETGVMRFGSAGRQVESTWLALEAQHGDPQMVARMRRQRFATHPSDEQNFFALAQILINQDNFQEVDQMVERVKREAPDFDPALLARIEAGLMLEEGGVDPARAVLQAAIDNTEGETQRAELYRVLGDLEERAGNEEAAYAAFSQGVAGQGPDLAGDKSLADYLNRRGRRQLQLAAQAPSDQERVRLREAGEKSLEEAQAIYTRVLAARDGADKETGLQLAQVQRRLENFEAMERTLGDLAEALDRPNDLDILTLRVEAQVNQDNMEQARSIMDTAVRQNSDNPVAFYRRARINIDDENRLTDVIADLDRAVALRPNYVDAWRLLAVAHQNAGDEDAALRKIRAAINANPNNTDLPRLLVGLLTEAGRLGEAQIEAGRLAAGDGAERAGDPEWIRAAGNLALQAGNFSEAARWFQQLYEIEDSPAVAADLLNAMLRRQGGAPISDVNRLMRRVAELEVEGGQRLNLLLLQARGEAARGNEQGANEYLIRAHEVAGEFGSAGFAAWAAQASERFDGDLDRFYTFLETEEELQPLHPWLELELVQRDQLLRGDLQAASSRLAAIQSQINPEEDPRAALRFLRLAHRVQYNAANYEQAAQLAAQGLAINPDDVELNNNLGYTLSAHLGRHEEALPYAIRASELQPRASSVLDTLGTVYLALSDLEKAQETLTRALNLAASDSERLPAAVHLADAEQRMGRPTQARRAVQTAQDALRALGDVPIARQYGPEVQRLNQEIN